MAGASDESSVDPLDQDLTESEMLDQLEMMRFESVHYRLRGGYYMWSGTRIVKLHDEGTRHHARYLGVPVRGEMRAERHEALRSLWVQAVMDRHTWLDTRRALEKANAELERRWEWLKESQMRLRVAVKEMHRDRTGRSELSPRETLELGLENNDLDN